MLRGNQDRSDNEGIEPSQTIEIKDQTKPVFHHHLFWKPLILIPIKTWR